MLALSLLLVLAPPSFRDQIASAWDHPLICSAEMVERLQDDAARINVAASPIQIRWPGVRVVKVDGRPVTAKQLAPDLVSVDIPTGEHQLELGRDAAASEDAVPAGTLTPELLASQVAETQPGETLTIPDGLYRDFRIKLDSSGTAEQPIVIRSATPGGAIFTGNSSWIVSGNFVTVQGLRFEHCGPGTVVGIDRASGCRITQCLFFECGNPQSTFQHIVPTVGSGAGNRVDHCFWTGSRSMACAVRVQEGNSPKRQRIDHNIFRDTVRYWVNGQENVQLGQNQRGKTGAERPQATVEQNLFDHAWGDSEVISNKSTGNTIRHNLAAWCYRAAFTLRGGDSVRFEGNAVVGGGGGVRVMGTHHTIVNNFFAGLAEPAVYCETGSQDGESQIATTDTLMACNTVVDCPAAFGAMHTTEARPHMPERVRIEDNLVIGSTGEPVAMQDSKDVGVARLVNLPAPENETPAVDRYAAWLSGEATPPADAVDHGVAIEGVDQDLLARPRDAQPDIGCLEAGAGPARARLPALTAKPLLDPSIYRGQLVKSWPEGQPAGELISDPAAKTVLNWSWHPESYASTAWLSIGGYRLAWGGVAEDGKPKGFIRLYRGEEVVAMAADLVYYRLDFVYQGWLGRTLNETTEPGKDDWYQFQMVKDGGRLFVTLRSLRHQLELPLVAWRDRAGGSSGPLAIGSAGAGRFGELRLYAYDYAGGRAPDKPGPLRAEAVAGRVRLGWTEAPRDAGAVTYRIECTTPGQAEPRLVVAGIGGGAFDDFGAPAGANCRYTMRAVNRFGLSSEPVNAEVTAPGGTFTALMEAPAATLEQPFSTAMDDDGQRYVTPGNVAAEMQGAPESGGATFRFTLPTASEVALYGLVTAADNGHDSFYLQVDDGEFATWYTGIHSHWEWSKCGQIKLAAGEHRIRVKHREPGPCLAKLVVTADVTLAPVP